MVTTILTGELSSVIHAVTSLAHQLLLDRPSLSSFLDRIAGSTSAEHLLSDNGSEFTAKAVRQWLETLGVTTLFIAPGSPWENGYVESLIGKMRDELLNREIFYTLDEAGVLIEQWRKEYNQVRPHSSLGYRPPAPEAIEWPLGAEPFPST